MSFKVYLKPNDKIYINGAVLQVDRKTTLEFLNDVNFLLQNQILQVEQANTPLKRLYYVVQIMLMAPNDTEAALAVYRSQFASLVQAFLSPKIASELKSIDRLIHEKSFHSAMKSIRDLFKVEEEVLANEQGWMANSLKTVADVMHENDIAYQQGNAGGR